MFRDGSFDLVLAVDSFPYLVQAGVAGRHVQDAARLLRPGGDLVALNYAYFGAPEDHVRELLGFAEPAGLAPVRMGQRDMAGWDGVTFHLRKPGAGAATPPTGR
jgi:SAM-dependent methyltransferase